MTKYTILVSDDEYGVGFYDTIEEANTEKIRLIRSSDPNLSECTDEEILYDYDSEFRVLTIVDVSAGE